MDEAKVKPAKAGSRRPDGRIPLLVYLPPILVHDLKAAALAENVHAYALVEEAVASLLAQRAKD